MNNANDLIDSYFNWLKQKIKLKNVNDTIEITTPLLDRHNDHLQIYVISNGNNIRLTDDSYIISDLLMSGCDIKSSRKRTELLKTILRGYGVSLSEEDELYIDTTIDKFPQMKHMLLQAMLTVNDMFMTTRETVESLFSEDVENFLIANDIRYSDQLILRGKSGFDQTFDFIINRSRNYGDRVIKVVNYPTKSRAESIIFSWGDIKDGRKNETKLFTFLNDSNRKVSSDILTAFEQYDIQPVLWSKRNDVVPILSA